MSSINPNSPIVNVNLGGLDDEVAGTFQSVLAIIQQLKDIVYTAFNSLPTPGTGTVTSVSVTTANGVSGSVATPTVTPAITLTLAAITPTSVTPSGLVDISGAAAGQIKFPATQNPSSNANTLDDYEEGTWTPVLTCVTPGDLNVVYSVQLGFYRKVGRFVDFDYSIQTSTFTYTTASGNVRVTGQPFTTETTANHQPVGTLCFQGITKAGFSQFVTRSVANSTIINIIACNTGSAQTAVAIGDMPSAGTVILDGNMTIDSTG